MMSNDPINLHSICLHICFVDVYLFPLGMQVHDVGIFESFSDEELGPRIDQLGADVRRATVELNKNKAVWKTQRNLFENKRVFFGR